MRKSVGRAAIAVCLMVWGMACPAHAWWPLNGTCAWTSHFDNIPNSITSDSLGGSIIALAENEIHGYGSSLVVQKLGYGGTLPWGTNGIYPPGQGSYNGGARLAPDGSGGVFAAWVVTSSVNQWVCGALIRANKTTVALPIYQPPGFPQAWQGSPSIVPDGSGGTIVAYEQDLYTGNNFDIYAQRFDGNGSALWGQQGVAVCAAADYQRIPQLIPEGGGGAIVAWLDVDGIRAQRIDADGAFQWAASGVRLCGITNSLGYLQIISDGSGGAIAAWQDKRSGTVETYGQRVDAAGNALWGTNGILLCAASGSQSNPGIVSDGAHGAIIVWRDLRSGTADLYAQRIDSNGAPQWAADGVPVCTAPGDQASHTIASDGAGGAIFAWADKRGGNYDVYCQRIDAAGTTLWGENGSVVCSQSGNQTYVVMTGNGAGGVVVGWRDERRATPYEADVYAMLVSDGLAPVATLLQSMSTSAVGEGIHVEWTVSEAPDGVGFAVSRAEAVPDQFVEMKDVRIVRDGLSFTFTDDQCKPGTTYRYRVELLGESGHRTLFETEAIAVKAPALVLRQNHPNPFNPSTSIEYSLPQRCRVTLEVFDAAGRFVAGLVDEEQPQGSHRVSWNGKDASGAGVASGVYFAQLKAGKDFKTTKMILLR